jgi:hypothetical protein
MDRPRVAARRTPTGREFLSNQSWGEAVATRRVRAEGLNGAAVSAVMKDASLTHGGFYKHLHGLLLEPLREGSPESRFYQVGTDTLAKHVPFESGEHRQLADHGAPGRRGEVQRFGERYDRGLDRCLGGTPRMRVFATDD